MFCGVGYLSVIRPWLRIAGDPGRQPVSERPQPGIVSGMSDLRGAAGLDDLHTLARGRGIGTRLSASFGAASLPHDAGDWNDLVRCADRALHAAKAAGRNRVTAFDGPSGAPSPVPGIAASGRRTEGRRPDSHGDQAGDFES